MKIIYDYQIASSKKRSVTQGIVIHQVGAACGYQKPLSTLKYWKKQDYGAHFIVDNETVYCYYPVEDVAKHVKSAFSLTPLARSYGITLTPNMSCIGIEMTNGKHGNKDPHAMPSKQTIETTRALVAWLREKYGYLPLITHHDVTTEGKYCPGSNTSSTYWQGLLESDEGEVDLNSIEEQNSTVKGYGSTSFFLLAFLFLLLKRSSK